MPSIESFLFFLQKHPLYFSYQDQILEILSANFDRRYIEIVTQIETLCPALVQRTINTIQKMGDPFPNKNFVRIKFGDPDYPQEFVRLIDPPLVISILGKKIWQNEKISIVGSRMPSQKTLWWIAKELHTILARENVISVSGGAIGVDQIVHQTSINLNRPTIAILPSGLGVLYPRSFSDMARVILETGGCLLSEFADEAVVKKYHFSYRNRLIAALGKFAIIVEAREKSGSMITAHRALELGKEVFVVPGHPLEECFRGSIELLKLGAHIITRADDIDYWF